MKPAATELGQGPLLVLLADQEVDVVVAGVAAVGVHREAAAQRERDLRLLEHGGDPLEGERQAPRPRVRPCGLSASIGGGRNPSRVPGRPAASHLWRAVELSDRVRTVRPRGGCAGPLPLSGMADHGDARRGRRLRTVALVGIDGSGKTTQAHRLAERARRRRACRPPTGSNAGGRRWFGRLAQRLGRRDGEQPARPRGMLVVESVLRWLAIARALLAALVAQPDIAVMDRYAVCQYASIRAHAGGRRLGAAAPGWPTGCSRRRT